MYRLFIYRLIMKHYENIHKSLKIICLKTEKIPRPIRFLFFTISLVIISFIMTIAYVWVQYHLNALKPVFYLFFIPMLMLIGSLYFCGLVFSFYKNTKNFYDMGYYLSFTAIVSIPLSLVYCISFLNSNRLIAYMIQMSFLSIGVMLIPIFCIPLTILIKKLFEKAKKLQTKIQEDVQKQNN